MPKLGLNPANLCYDFFMVSFKQAKGLLFRPRLKRLQEMQAEIFRQLLLMIPDDIAYYDSFKSKVPGSPLLRMDVLERHPYTHFLRLTYQFEGQQPDNRPASGETFSTGQGTGPTSAGPQASELAQPEISPDAHIRMYYDAKLAEVTAFNPEQGFTRLAHPRYPTQQIFQRNWRQNLALDKWLGYLLHQGHGITSMQPATKRISGKHAIPVAQTISSL